MKFITVRGMEDESDVRRIACIQIQRKHEGKRKLYRE